MKRQSFSLSSRHDYIRSYLHYEMGRTGQIYFSLVQPALVLKIRNTAVTSSFKPKLGDIMFMVENGAFADAHCLVVSRI